MAQDKRDLVGKSINIDDFLNTNDLPRNWKDAKSGKPNSFNVKLYHSEDDSYYLALSEEFGGFKDETAVQMECSVPGTWIQASSLKEKPQTAANSSSDKAEDKAVKKADTNSTPTESKKEIKQPSVSENSAPIPVAKGKSGMNEQLTQAGVRVVADKLTNLVRNTLLRIHREMWLAKKNLAGVKKLNKESQMRLESYLEGIEDTLNSDIGKAGISYGLGYLLQEGKPKLAKYIAMSDSTDVIFDILSNEFKVAGLAHAGGTLVDKFFEMAAPQAGAFLSNVTPNIKAKEFEQLAKDSAEILSEMGLGNAETETVSVSNGRAASAMN